MSIFKKIFKRQLRCIFRLISSIADIKKRFRCKKSLKLGHTDITTLEKVRDQYGKGKFVQMEALSA
ncbi:hypothetical protein CN518_20345 [Bacillus anthracis]|nr:hypothetical protein CN518_20345 [Bacillus anthracis]